MRLGLAAAVFALILAACVSESPSPPVVVYAPVDMEENLQSWFAESDFDVTVVPGDDADHVNKIISKTDMPRADIVVTSSVVDLWRAADEGALRPIKGGAFDAVPSQLKDPDATWAALDYRYAVIAAGPGAGEALPRKFVDLGEPGLVAQLCLSTSALPANRVLISMMIEELGLKPAERIVRRRIRNLAQAPFSTEAELIAALKSGECSFGIIFGSVTMGSLQRLRPTPAYVDIDGIGIARHAENAEAAQLLVDWMLSERALGEPIGTDGYNVSIAGWRDEQARLLVERAGYR